MNNTLRITVSIALGGLTFWLPDALLHLWKIDDIRILTPLLPLSLAICYWVVFVVWMNRASGPSVALFMLIGLWELGPLFMMIGATPYGGGFAMPSDAIKGIFFSMLLPIYTFIMSGYDQSLLALLIATILLILFRVKFEKHVWLIPPSIWARLRRR
ncbi:MAG TPA: hypothetical protein VGQ72_10215 [Pyrinomonadaceae bacterium]|jgi:hypothetical protein|nr:hypothetical protein [Pyrinomonadaceae bacterium]